jgi:chromosome partitioning protein
VKACDYVVLPQQAEPLAIRSVPHMLETLARYRADGAGVKVAGILLTMVMREHEMSLRVARELREMLPAHLMFQQSIPRLPSFLDASALGVPVALISFPGWPSARVNPHRCALVIRCGSMRMRSLMPMSSGSSLETRMTALPSAVSRLMIS